MNTQNTLPSRVLPYFGVIASIMAKTSEEFLLAWNSALRAHSIEVRLDPLWDSDHLGKVLAALPELIDSNPDKPVILTLRSNEDGGGQFISIVEQYEFWRDSMPAELLKKIKDPASRVFADWTSGLVVFVQQQYTIPPFPWDKIGASIHIFDNPPSDDEGHFRIFQALTALPAKAFLKYVPMASATSVPDFMWKAFFYTLDTRPIITFWMGQHGEDSRRACMLLGSAGVFGYVPGHAQAAAGQLSIDELLDERMVVLAMKPQ